MQPGSPLISPVSEAGNAPGERGTFHLNYTQPFLQRGNTTIFPLPRDHFPTVAMTQWAQDVTNFLQAGKGGDTRLEMVYHPSRLDKQLARTMQEHILPNLSSLTTTHLDWDGGNILIGYLAGEQPYLLVGEDVFLKLSAVCSSASSDRLRHLLTTELRQKLNTEKIYWLTPGKIQNGSDQALFHIDLYITLCGIPLADPEKKELLLLAENSDRYIIALADADPADTQHVRTALEATLLWLENTDNHPEVSYRIVRIPLLLLDINGARRWASYNNCIVENIHGKITLYLPSYADHALEPSGNLTNNREPDNCSGHALEQASLSLYTWKKILEIENTLKEELESVYGISVKFISNNFLKFTREFGSLHCLAKVIQREN